MPKREAHGNPSDLFFGRRERSKSFSTLNKAVRAATVIESLEHRTLLSATWFVATNGSDSNPGSLAAPFRTIQRAASIAGSGDVVDIFGGTYHETVNPANSGVTFQNYNNQTVTVSGADPITSWSKASGNIYQANMSWDLGEGNNQLFDNGSMVNEARWPNTSTNLTWPSLASIQSGGGGGNTVTIHDSHLSGGWQGASIHIMPGSGWYAQTGTVTASGSGWLTFNYSHDESWTEPRSGNQYYLYGKYQGLDSAGEWFRDSSGHLSLWAPNNANPASQDIEVKRRAYAFDLSGNSNTTINGINIFAATIKTDGGSSNTVINHLRATYLSQFTWQNIGYQQPDNSGIMLFGNNSVLENSTIAWSAGDGVIVRGNNVRVTQNVIHDIDYNAGDSAGVRVFGSNDTIDHNLIYNAGRCGINVQGYADQIVGNTIHDVMLQTSDGAAIYTVHSNGNGSQISYNAIYSVHERVPGSSPTYFSANGIFLDNSASNWLVQNNQIADVDGGVKMNFYSTNNRVLNNVLSGNVGSIVGNSSGSWSGSTISGNTLYSSIAMANPGARISSNNNAHGTPHINPSAVPPPDPVPTQYNGGGNGNSGGGNSGGGNSGGSNSGGSSNSGSGSSGSGKNTGGSGGTKNPGHSGGGSNSGSGGSGNSGSGNTGSDNSGSDGSGNDFVGYGGASGAFSVIGPMRPNLSQATPATQPIAPITFTSQTNATATNTAAINGTPGTVLEYDNIDFGNGVKALAIQLTAVGTKKNARVQIRLDGKNGKLISTVMPRSGKKASAIQMRRVGKITGVHNLYFVVAGKAGTVSLGGFAFTPASK